MANIDGGALSFKAQLDNGQLNAAIDETLRRIKGMSDGTVAAGDKVDATFSSMTTKIREQLAQIGDACTLHEQALARLEQEYADLGVAAGNAFNAGRDDEYRSIEASRTAIQGEITVRRTLLTELREQSNELEKAASALEREQSKADATSQSHVTMRTRLREMREELIAMEMAGKRNTEEYREMQVELGRLTDAYNDATRQANVMAHDQRGLQGVISGLSGVSGAISAATGTMSLFVGENENLQKVMTKIQSVMAITIGLQQVEQTLNKDSAFRLVTVTGLKEWWNRVVKESTVNVAAETASMTANAVATGAQAATATAATAANTGLAASIRLVGVAIKNIPVIGWILAAVSALIAIVAKVTKSVREANKAQQELTKSTIDNCYKSIGSIQQLSLAWNELGDDMSAKEQFIKDNSEAFDSLNASVKNVTDAENLLVTNKQAFIDAEIAKAKAIALRTMAQEKIKTLLEEQMKLDSMPTTTRHDRVNASGFVTTSYTEGNRERDKQQQVVDKLNAEVTQLFNSAASYEKDGWNVLTNAGIAGAGEYAAGTVGAIEKAIADKQQALKHVSDSTEYKAIQDDIAKLNEQLAGITGESGTGGGKTSEGDPFVEMLNNRKNEYRRFAQWMNSGDAIIAKSAQQEFAGLLAEGANYMEYLQRQRQNILDVDETQRTREQVEQLASLNNAIAEETRNTVIEAFDNQLNDELNKATSTLEMLNIIAEKRNELANDNTDLDNAKRESLDKAEQDVQEQITNEREERIKEMQREREERDQMYAEMLQSYASYTEQRAAIEQDFETQRTIAREHNDTEMIKKINAAEKKALSELATNTLTNSDLWNNLFDNFETATIEEIDGLINSINNRTIDIAGDMTEKDLQDIINELEKLRSMVANRNPFDALKDAIRQFKNESSDANLNKVMQAGSNLADNFMTISDSMKQIAAQIGDEKMAVAAEAVGDILGNIQAAQKGAEAWGGWWGAIIGGVADGLPKLVKWISGERELEKAIAEQELKVTKLRNEYAALEYAVKNALGGDVYAGQQQLIANLQEQIDELEEAQELAEESKNPDENEIENMKAQQDDLKRQIDEITRQIADDLLQTNAKTFADNLGSALVDAFTNGEDAAKAFETTVNNVLRNVVINQLKKTFLEQQLQGALDDLQSSLGHWNGDTFVFDGLAQDDVAAFKEKIKHASDNFANAYEVYADAFGDIFGLNETSSLSGAVKGVTEETASILAGQINAIRINQSEGNDILRQQLAQLSQIVTNTAFLEQIYMTVQSIRNALGSSDLRSHGFINE